MTPSVQRTRCSNNCERCSGRYLLVAQVRRPGGLYSAAVTLITSLRLRPVVLQHLANLPMSPFFGPCKRRGPRRIRRVRIGAPVKQVCRHIFFSQSGSPATSSCPRSRATVIRSGELYLTNVGSPPGTRRPQGDGVRALWTGHSRPSNSCFLSHCANRGRPFPWARFQLV